MAVPRLEVPLKTRSLPPFIAWTNCLSAAASVAQALDSLVNSLKVRDPMLTTGSLPGLKV